jgi:hypothetical protein
MATIATTSHSTIAPVLLRPRDYQWCWKSVSDPWSTINEEQWHRYTDVEIEIIEDAFNEKKDEVEIDNGYIIDLRLMLQNDRLDKSNTRPVKRESAPRTNHNNDPTREQRFALPIAVTSLSLTSASSPSDREQEWKGTGNCGSTYQILELAQQDKNIAYVVEEAARGIIEEGEAQGKTNEALWLAHRLLDVKRLGDSVQVVEYWTPEIPSFIGQTCVNLYTKESFWYKTLNLVMQDSSKVTRKHVKTLGPFCFLLQNYLRQNEKYDIPTVFRGIDLTDEQRRIFSNDVQFCSFTSASKSRPVAEFYNRNTLLVIDLNMKKREGLDVGRAGAFIARWSFFPLEEEFLFWPQTSFHFIRAEYDKLNEKHIIYLKSYQTNG